MIALAIHIAVLRNAREMVTMLKAEEARHLQSIYERESAKIKNVKSTSTDENNYGIAYQNLVKAGLALQIKKKYRG